MTEEMAKDVFDEVVPPSPSPEIAAIVARLNALEKLDATEALDLESVLSRLSDLEGSSHVHKGPDTSDIGRWVGELATTVDVLQAGVDSRPRREELIAVDAKLSKVEDRVAELESAQSQLERQSVIDHGVLAELRGGLDKLTSDFAEAVCVEEKRFERIEEDIVFLSEKLRSLAGHAKLRLEDQAEKDQDMAARAKLREVAQILIEEIGAEGPEDAVTTAERAAWKPGKLVIAERQTRQRRRQRMKVWQRKRRGRFAISARLLSEASEAFLACVFSKIRVWRAEPDVSIGLIVYDGTSELFREVDNESEVPWYRILVTDKGSVPVMNVEESTTPLWAHEIPFGYGSGVIEIPAGLSLVDAKTGEVVCDGSESTDQ